MSCIKEMEVCSLDEKYALQKVTWEECMHFMACIPTAVVPENMRVQGCENLPLANNATTAEGPVYEITPKQEQTAGDSQSLQQSVFTVAAILTLAFAYMRL